jgi:hypothetical protein
MQCHMTNDDLPSEIEEYTTVRTQRRRLLPRAALVGLAAGLVASLFRLSLAGADGAQRADRLGAPVSRRGLVFSGLVRVVSGGRELVPTASTRLEAYSKITAVIAPEAERGVERLREGCKAREKAAEG